MNTIGNMCNRILKYTFSNLKNDVPRLDLSLYHDVDKQMILEVSQLINKYCQHFENVEIKAAAQIVLEIGQALNKYLQDTQFWSKANVSSNRY